jgi:hypothetical protein
MNIYSTNPPKSGAIEENAAKFESDLAKADAVRATHLSGLQKLRAAKTNRDQRELKLIADSLGEDHPKVVRLKTDVAAGQHLTQVLSVEVDRTTAARPVGDKSSWTVYGFVRNPELQGQARLTVALFDRADRWMEAVGYVCTDSRGYFQLRYDPGADKLREVCIHVSDPKSQILYRDAKPMTPVLGEVKYREIILNGESDCCQPPSDPSSKEPPSSTKQPARSKSRKTKAPKKAPRAKKE